MGLLSTAVKAAKGLLDAAPDAALNMTVDTTKGMGAAGVVVRRNR